MSWRSWLFPNAVLFAGALTLAATAHAQETCPPPHDDYRRPIPVWGGFGYQVNACPGDKIEVAASLIVPPDGNYGMMNIPQTLPWSVDLSGLPPEDMKYLREHCESDMPCAAHFKLTVIKIEGRAAVVRPGRWRDGGCHGSASACVTATLDGWR